MYEYIQRGLHPKTIHNLKLKSKNKLIVFVCMYIDMCQISKSQGLKSIYIYVNSLKIFRKRVSGGGIDFSNKS